jgi:hypothetical protein
MTKTHQLEKPLFVLAVLTMIAFVGYGKSGNFRELFQKTVAFILIVVVSGSCSSIQCGITNLSELVSRDVHQLDTCFMEFPI